MLLVIKIKKRKEDDPFRLECDRPSSFSLPPLEGATAAAESYLRQSQVTSRCDSVIRKMLWMARAARICLMVSGMTSGDSAVFTSMEPRKRTMNSWWRIESGRRHGDTLKMEDSIEYVAREETASCISKDSSMKTKTLLIISD